MAAALIDHLLHHGHVVNIRGYSYRMREHRELYDALHSPAPEETARSQPKRRSGRREAPTS